jgi:branched-chain amino acid transport system permease protein
MFYRLAGQFKSTYAADQQLFPIRQDRLFMIALAALAFVVVPLIADDYWLGAILVPFLILGLAALGLNILTGYTGQLSLGTAGFMAVGAFAAFNFILRVPGMPFLVALFLAGLVTALIGVVFGLPSVRIKGFYLAVATLAAQFFIEWVLTKFGWFSNYNPSGVITAQHIQIAGLRFDTPLSKYLLTLAIVTAMALAAKNLARTQSGRFWMAVRDMDLAAEVIGIDIVRTKLVAFAVSSFYCGVAGALWAYAYLGAVEPQAFTLDRSFQILFMIIIGGVGTVMGAFIGSAFIVLLPIALNVTAHTLLPGVSTDLTSNLELVIFGGLIVFFLAVEPHGLARLWQIGKEKLRLWPFPH